MSDSALVHFVRDVLGCGCPDEVLQSITVDRGRHVPAIEDEITRIDVGARLLVYVLELESTEAVEAVIPQAVEAGVTDRDGHGFNRFRLVIASEDPAAIETAARPAFDAVELPDDRVHLHVVAVEDCPRSIGGC